MVLAFKRCHKENPIGKTFGACNDEKWALDACLKGQKKYKSKLNLEKARAEQAKLKAKREAKLAEEEKAAKRWWW